MIFRAAQNAGSNEMDKLAAVVNTNVVVCKFGV